MSVLGTQPPLLGTTTARYVSVASKEIASNQDLVPIGTYHEEKYDYNDYYSRYRDEESSQLMLIWQRQNNLGHGPPPMGRGQESSTQGLGP